MFATQDVTITDGSQTKVHCVGPFAGTNAVMFWGAMVAAVVTTVAMATPKWFTTFYGHDGLWKWCAVGSECVNFTYRDLTGEQHYKPCNEMIV